MVVVLVVGIAIGASAVVGAWRRNPDKVAPPEAKQLHFAAATLTGLGLIFALSMAMYYWGAPADPGTGTAAKEIFDACKTILPPIVTLILGYYFGRKE